MPSAIAFEERGKVVTCQHKVHDCVDLLANCGHDFTAVAAFYCLPDFGQVRWAEGDPGMNIGVIKISREAEVISIHCRFVIGHGVYSAVCWNAEAGSSEELNWCDWYLTVTYLASPDSYGMQCSGKKPQAKA